MESGDSLFHKYTSYLKKKLGLLYSPGDLSLFYQTIEDILQGFLSLYVDETLAEGNEEFVKFTDKIPEEFQ